ncbi:MAG TPA: AsmA-like C-terminal region-containing protein, partial [Stellaceae bacterium]|nr:AsmA-like C-terminal region-containing protein [Stellaceae bacterium]
EKTDFAELSGSYKITNGVIDNRDMKMLAPLVRLSGSGTVPMPPQTIDYTVAAKLVASTEGQGGQDALAGLDIPVKITGPWSDPKYDVDWKSVFTEMAKDPNRLKNLPGDLGKAAKNFGVNLPGTGGGGALPNVPGLPQGGGAAPAPAPTPGGQAAPPPSQQKTPAPKIPGLPNPFGK